MRESKSKSGDGGGSSRLWSSLGVSVWGTPTSDPHPSTNATALRVWGRKRERSRRSHSPALGARTGRRAGGRPGCSRSRRGRVDAGGGDGEAEGEHTPSPVFKGGERAGAEHEKAQRALSCIARPSKLALPNLILKRTPHLAQNEGGSARARLCGGPGAPAPYHAAMITARCATP
jgi:hypothetical protein